MIRIKLDRDYTGQQQKNLNGVEALKIFFSYFEGTESENNLTFS